MSAPDAATVAAGERYGVANGWLFEYVNEHTCGTARDGYYGAHEPGCGMEPIAKVDDLLAAASRVESAEAEASNAQADYDRRGERLWRLAASAEHVPHESDNDASAELSIAQALAAVEAVARVEALADEWAEFEHDAVACPKYDCGNCTMLNAIYDLRAALRPSGALVAAMFIVPVVLVLWPRGRR